MKQLHSLRCATTRSGLIAAATLMAFATLDGASAAEPELTGTLLKVRDEHVITIGYRDASIPFSYYDADQKPIGYSIDVANLIVERIKANLKLADLKVRAIPITSQNRISLLQNGTIDFECTSTTNNAERAQQVSFSNSFFVIGTRLLVNRKSGIKDFADLKGKTVVVGAGTTSEKILRRMNVEKSMGMDVISAKDHTESFLMLSTGRAKAMMMDDALLAGERAKARNPGDYEIVGTPQTYEAYGCMLRRNDAQMKAAMDAAIADAQKSGVAAKIYRRWFQQPIPPKHVNLHLPLSPRMEALFANPGDKPTS
ncbi:glutamate/aspartate ABC transporter substrate-binding protein [Paraburkholderia rhynchosiae]|uniref:Amino acid ABC transporter substrate-binding protein n=1 Tax=Paraburkholderia rhynchosiae TaxID=487049 RepID=A0A2N7WXB1_9BURK|nr:glutamate/aspartate ABC transporter substrate-binding protein [Paraburkholderia rhynchosiae]PMS34020.1 amino acid ABC transporter substrate-binding protein [Paraburkholderia rhynchosiae]CAB3635991.1 Glutamate/aspartate import solute-binding protein [Paraburkholderia rhynchosiae]